MTKKSEGLEEKVHFPVFFLVVFPNFLVISSNWNGALRIWKDFLFD